MVVPIDGSGIYRIVIVDFTNRISMYCLNLGTILSAPWTTVYTHWIINILSLVVCIP